MRHLGIDYGSKKVGLALSDEAGTMGFPYKILSNTPRLLEELLALIKTEKVGMVVIGESRNLAGEDNPVAKYAKKLGEQLEERAHVPVAYESEVFTSIEARRMPESHEKSRKLRVYVPVDASAAALILTSYISRTNHG